ncbi:prolyl endopeptidase FAP-like isoform X2 [Seriola aureovittata]|nr:prolyl endopeptidase FAP-like isoform X2 [Seriola aureovittata]
MARFVFAPLAVETLVYSFIFTDRLLETFFTPSDIPDEVQYFAWAPQGHKLAFVWGNNVYIKTSPGSARQQVTFNGEDNWLLNGIPDWVYEEEMFSTNQGLWWSPGGGEHVAYAEFNDTEVRNIEYTWYGAKQYPSTVSIAYPKPGTPNRVVKLFVVNTDNVTEITEVLVPASFSTSENYLATVQWLKRVQNHLILQIYSLSGSR